MSVNSLKQVTDSDSIQRKKKKVEKKKLLILLKQDIFLEMITKKMDWDWHNYFNFFMKIMTERSGSTYFSTCILLLIALI